MNNKNDRTVFAYLNSIDSGPLLTREQEEQLIKKVEVYQKQILKELVISKYAREELKTYLQSLESSGESIIDISKKLDEESSKELVSTIESKFKALIKEVAKDNVELIMNLLDDVSLTGTIIHGIVTEIKKKHTKITDVEYKVRQIRKFFGGESNDTDMFNEILNESTYVIDILKNEYKLSDVKVSNRISEWKQIIKEFEDTSKLVVDATFFDVKDIYRRIAISEGQAQQFKDELITKNLRLVVSRAKKFLNKGLEFEDLIQEGNIGLMKAVDKFDSSKKTKISTYATWWIDQSIRRAISNKGKTVRVPTHIEWMQTNLNQLVQKMTGDLKRPPTLVEISKESGIELKVLEDLHTRAQHEIGLEDELSSGMSLLDILPDHSESPFAITEQNILKEKMREILSTLKPGTEKLIRLRFGIGEVPNDEGMTLQAIADEIDITKQGVRVRECAGLKELRKKMKGLANE